MQLVSMMLGREVTEVRRHGVTAFGDEGHDVARAPVLTATGLTRRHQLDAISLELHAGEVLGLGGLLGSGRSETAKALAGALPLDAGEISIAGRPMRRSTSARAIRAGISLLPEDRKAEGIVPGLSVRENIVLAAMPRLSRAGIVSRRQQDRIVDVFMKRLRIKASSPEQKVGELSGGNQQKVLLARWLCLEPKVLLLDEPTRGIDVGAKAEVQALIDELAQEGLAVLLISSDIEELVEGSDRIVVLLGGAVAGELTGDQVGESSARLVAERGPRSRHGSWAHTPFASRSARFRSSQHYPYDQPSCAAPAQDLNLRLGHLRLQVDGRLKCQFRPFGLCPFLFPCSGFPAQDSNLHGPDPPPTAGTHSLRQHDERLPSTAPTHKDRNSQPASAARYGHPQPAVKRRTPSMHEGFFHRVAKDCRRQRAVTESRYGRDREGCGA
jgi:ABC-type multidrug transport system ATPase subunit